MLVQAQFVQVSVDLIKDVRLLLLIKTAALQHFSDDMCALLVHG